MGVGARTRLGRLLFRRLAPLVDEIVRIAVDDTVAPKKRPHVFGIGSHLDAVRLTKRQKVFTFGHCWVTLAVLVKVPFSSRIWALPVLFRLYRTVKECERRGVQHRKKTELAREMLDLLSTWVPARRVELAADSAYCNDTVTRDLSEHIVLFRSMRPDAVITAAPNASNCRQISTDRRCRLQVRMALRHESGSHPEAPRNDAAQLEALRTSSKTSAILPSKREAQNEQLRPKAPLYRGR